MDSGIVIAEYQGYAFTNLSAPLWIELYYGGGYTLLILGFVLLALLWSSLDRRWANCDPASSARIVVALLTTYQLAILRGSLLTVTARGALLVISFRSCYARRHPIGSPETLINA